MPRTPRGFWGCSDFEEELLTDLFNDRRGFNTPSGAAKSLD